MKNLLFSMLAMLLFGMVVFPTLSVAGGEGLGSGDMGFTEQKNPGTEECLKEYSEEEMREIAEYEAEDNWGEESYCSEDSNI